MNEMDRTENIPVIKETETPKRSKKKKPHKKGTFRRNMVPWNIALTVLAVLANAGVLYVLYSLNDYANLSTSIFVKINLIGAAVLAVIDLILIAAIKTKFIALFVAAAVAVVVSIGGAGYAEYALIRVKNSVDNLTASEHTEDVSTSFVINSTSTAMIHDLTDLAGKTVGYAIGTSNAELGQAQLEQNGISVNYKEYNTSEDVLQGLVKGEIDCAIVPSSYQASYADDEVLGTYVESMVSLLDFKDTVTITNDAGSDKDLTTEPFTVLLTGENGGLADTIMVLSVNPVSMKITMSSIARDSFVPISCYYGSYSKINAAHAVSEECMVQTVEDLMGITIDYTIEFDFASVIEVVDAVGGVDVDIPVEFDAQCWDIVNDELVVIHLPEGDNIHLDGQQALGFARERHAFADGDFARQRHQQEIIQQVIEKIMATRDPNTLLNVLDAAGDNIITNFSKEQIMNFVSYAMDKANRYYNQGSLSGVFDIQTSRVYGYDSSSWDDNLQMSLYIYPLFQGSIDDTTAAIERNIDLYYPISSPSPVSWSSGESYEAPDISATWYNEATDVYSSAPETTYTETSTSTEEQAPAEEVVVEPETPEETEEPVVPEETEEPVTPEETTEPSGESESSGESGQEG